MRMVQAQSLQAFTGSIAFERGGQLATYRIENQIEGAGNQSLKSLNREQPEQSYSFLCGKTPWAAEENLLHLSNLYNFYRPGDSIVAGRDAVELLMLPVDGNRYGYGFSVDADTYLPLRTVVLTPQRTPVERYEYVDIDIQDLPVMDSSCPEQQNVDVNASWVANVLPTGFQPSQIRHNPESDENLIVVSDGLATISINIKPVVSARFPPVTTRLGATNVLLSYLSFQQQIYLATLVGEVPMQSLELIVSGLGPASTEIAQ